ncbi:MAG TPA: CBS domain-containing protein [Mycobacteriales bacterium]
MTSPVITVRPGTTVRDAAAILLEHRITAAPVIDDHDELVGMVSEGDLVIDRFGHDPRSRMRPVEDEPPGPQTVGDVMTTTVIALGPSADAADMAQTMLDSDVRSIPIVEGASVVGIVSRRDLLRTLIRDDDAIRADVLARIAVDREPGEAYEVDVDEGAVTIYTDAGPEKSQAAVALARTVPGVSAAHLGQS